MDWLYESVVVCLCVFVCLSVCVIVCVQWRIQDFWKGVGRVAKGHEGVGRWEGVSPPHWSGSGEEKNFEI